MIPFRAAGFERIKIISRKCVTKPATNIAPANWLRTRRKPSQRRSRKSLSVCLTSRRVSLALASASVLIIWCSALLSERSSSKSIPALAAICLMCFFSFWISSLSSSARYVLKRLSIAGLSSFTDCLSFLSSSSRLLNWESCMASLSCNAPRSTTSTGSTSIRASSARWSFSHALIYPEPNTHCNPAGDM